MPNTYHPVVIRLPVWNGAIRSRSPFRVNVLTFATVLIGITLGSAITVYFRRRCPQRVDMGSAYRRVGDFDSQSLPVTQRAQVIQNFTGNDQRCSRFGDDIQTRPAMDRDCREDSGCRRRMRSMSAPDNRSNCSTNCAA